MEKISTEIRLMKKDIRKNGDDIKDLKTGQVKDNTDKIGELVEGQIVNSTTLSFIKKQNWWLFIAIIGGAIAGKIF